MPSGGLRRLSRREVIELLVQRRIPRGEARALAVQANLKGVAPSDRWEIYVVSPERGLYTVQDYY